MKSLFFVVAGLYLGKCLRNNQSELIKAIINILAWKV